MTQARKTYPFKLLMALAAIAVVVVTLAPQVMPRTDGGTIVIPMADSHHTEHSPINPDAGARIQAAMTFWGTGPQNDRSKMRCTVLYYLDQPVRWIVWQFTHTSVTGVARGNLSWFDAQGWQDSYANKSGDTLTKLPQDLKDDSRFKMNEVDCHGPDFPGGFPPLSVAGG